MQIVDFIREYWQYISIALVIVIDIVFIFVKKRPLSLDEFQAACDDMYRNLPYLICQVEKDFIEDGSIYEDVGDGSSKKYLCVQLACNFVEKKLKRSLTRQELEKVQSMASWCIESILETPTKKGGLGREKNS